jgi:hypothetical protein
VEFLFVLKTVRARGRFFISRYPRLSGLRHIEPNQNDLYETSTPLVFVGAYDLYALINEESLPL